MPQVATTNIFADVSTLVRAERMLVIAPTPRAADVFLQAGFQRAAVCSPARAGDLSEPWDLVVLDVRMAAGDEWLDGEPPAAALAAPAVFVASDARQSSRAAATLRAAGFTVVAVGSLGGVPGLLLVRSSSGHGELSADDVIGDLFDVTAAQATEVADLRDRLEALQREHAAALQRWSETTGLRWELTVARQRLRYLRRRLRARLIRA